MSKVTPIRKSVRALEDELAATRLPAKAWQELSMWACKPGLSPGDKSLRDVVRAVMEQVLKAIEDGGNAG